MRLSVSKAWLVLLASASVRLDMRGIGRAGGRKSGLASACLTCPGRVRRVYGLADRFRKLGRQVINAAGQAGKADAAEQDGSTECCRKAFLMVDMDIPPYIGCIHPTISLSTSNDGPVKMAINFSREKGLHFTTYSKGATVTVKAPAASNWWARASKRGSEPFLPINCRPKGRPASFSYRGRLMAG